MSPPSPRWVSWRRPWSRSCSPTRRCASSAATRSRSCGATTPHSSGLSPDDHRSGLLMASHVVLVGLMATGKTTIGRRVAKRLDRPFVDSDSELEERTGMMVRELFEKEGEAEFRRLETELLAELLDASEPSVIATGGGVVVTAANRDRLRQGDAFVVWLDAEPAFLASRAERKTTRPLLDGDPLGTLQRLSVERTPWYSEVADTRLDIGPAFREQEKPKDHLSYVIAKLVGEQAA